MHFLNLKLAFRYLLRNKAFSLINLGGLAVSLASCVFILYFVHDELSYDRSHENADRIYRVTTTFVDPPNTNRIRFTDQKVGAYLKDHHPQVENFVRMADFKAVFQSSTDHIEEPSIFKADQSVFDVFTYPLIAGNSATALEKKNSIILSESLSKKYFNDPALGKTITINKDVYEVTGIMKDVPANSDKWVNGFVSADFDSGGDNVQVQFDTFVLLQNSISVDEFDSSLSQAAAEIWHQDINNLGVYYEVQPLTDLHFTKGIQMDNPKGNKTNVYIFIGVAVVLMLVAVFNFINLSTARSLSRAREVGVRKVTGATRSILVKQFIGESMLSTVIAGFFALVLIKGITPFFTMLTGKEIVMSWRGDLILLLIILGLLIVVAFVASFYPAWILSSFKPALVLKSNVRKNPKGIFGQQTFIVAQFALSTAVFACLAVVLLQMNHVRTAEPGFTHGEIVVVETPYDPTVAANINFFKNELLKNKSVLRVASGGPQSLPGGATTTMPVWYKNGSERELSVQVIAGDTGYVDLMRINLTEGKLIKDYPQNQWGDLALVNEKLVKDAGIENAVGEKIETFSFSGRKQLTIAGVVKDFHFRSLHNVIEPMIYLTDVNENNYLYLEIAPGKLDDVKQAWKKLMPEYPLQFTHLNESFKKQYSADNMLSALLVFFSLLTLILAGLGLYGLIAYSVETRTREIGIRKVMGAEVLSIIGLLGKRFLQMVVIGATLGTAMAVYVSEFWLNGFAYRVEISWWQFGVPVLSVLCFSACIIVYQTIHSAKANPVDALKYE